MSTQIFVNLPVKDLQQATDFYLGLGYSKNPELSDDNATCIVVNEHICVMLLVERFFQTFTKKKICDSATHTEAILALSADTKQDVDTLVNQAAAGGGQPSEESMDQGGMYSRSFQDLDGHHWEVFWMDQAAAEQ
ncbi:MAG: glyoxalase [Actinomycetota bacterium]|nr:glyoxalase [Actinomycetota bacterium]